MMDELDYPTHEVNDEPDTSGLKISEDAYDYIDHFQLKHVLVAAIDFGTTFSGYAYSFTSNVTDIILNKSWGASLGFQSYKTPSALLVNDANEFVAFGYEAEELYMQADDDEAPRQAVHIYRHHKMALYNQKHLNRHVMVKSAKGRPMPVLLSTSLSLRYLKNHLLETLNKSNTKTPDVSMIQWVLTVPAIWSDEAKQLMREAAFQAGIIPSTDSPQLLIALEPEAASIYCRSLKVDHFVGYSHSNQQLSFKIGTKYLVVDAGGGTIDITAHEIKSDGNMRELFHASGGSWGGAFVNNNLKKLLEKLLGQKLMSDFQQNNSEVYLRMLTHLEKQKRAVKPDGQSRLSIDIPYSMGKEVEHYYGISIEKYFKTKNVNGVTFKSGLLTLSNDVVRTLYDPVTSPIVKHIDTIIKEKPLNGLQYIIMVGGFSESAFLQEAVRGRFESKYRVLIPAETTTVVIKGAVLFGHKPTIIASRIAQRSYGILVTPPFDDDKHDPLRRIMREDQDLCADVFFKFITAGEEIPTNFSKTLTFIPSASFQQRMKFLIYSTGRENVQYVDEPGVQLAGSFIVKNMSVKKRKEEVKVFICAGLTEFTVTAYSSTMEKYNQCSVNFLHE